MKAIITSLAVILVALACGCMTAAPAGNASSPSGSPAVAGTPAMAAAVIPDLTGTWTGSMQGYDVRRGGFTDYPDLSIALAITEQHGRLFAGNVTFIENGTQSVEGIAGVIGRDNRTFTISEEHGGYSFGEVIAPGEIELTYLHDGPTYNAAIDSLTRE